MPVYVAENVLLVRFCGLYIISAPNIDVAHERIRENKEGFENHEVEEIIENLREIKENEILYLYGSEW